MNILGISCYFHDSAAALLQDGILVSAAEEERFTRQKHDNGFPSNAIEFCLKAAKMEAGELDYVVFFEKPFVKFERILLSTLQTFPRSRRVFEESMVAWLGNKLWIKQHIQSLLNVPPERILFSDHHLSHAASAFFCSPYDEAAILTIDGVGEWTTASLAVGKGTDIRLLRTIDFPHSIGLLYSAFTAFLGFKVNEGEYKVMGMAPFGKPKYVDKVYKLVRVDSDGAFELDMDYFTYHHSPVQSYSSKFEELFGAPRDPKGLFFTADSGFPAYFGDKPADFEAQARVNQHYADIAASIQAVTEEIILKMARYAHKATGLKRLCVAGGVGLNSVANGRVLREGPFEDIYIQPSAGDGGGALGAALYAHHMVAGKPRGYVMEHAFYGQEHGEASAADYLAAQNVKHRRIDDDDKLLDLAVDRLQAGKVIGWHQGKFEWGPRALGHRSILADARRADMKDIVNTKIKFREPYRPFAPAILAERAAEFFDLKEPERHYPARFMLYVANVNPDKHAVIPATTHVDGTGRLQTVTASSNELYYGLIKRFGEATGVPVVLNTSFNMRWEPIVNTPEEAFKSFSVSGMDTLVLGHCVVEKEA